MLRAFEVRPEDAGKADRAVNKPATGRGQTEQSVVTTVTKAVKRKARKVEEVNYRLPMLEVWRA